MSPRNREHKQGKRQGPSLLGEVLERRIVLYVLAAGATLAGASAAQAQIVFTPSDRVLTGVLDGTNHLKIDLNNDGAGDFILNDYLKKSYGASSGSAWRLWADGRTASNGIQGISKNGKFFASALKKGAPIGSGGNFASFAPMQSRVDPYGFPYSYGNFRDVTNRFLGVRFLIKGEVHYGWIGFRKVDNFTAKLVGWAYEAQANTAIRAGDKGEEEPVSVRVPEPASLELLAAGNVAMVDWRRRRAG
jgi:hypothetical protein